jgi:L-lactate dehydrogenase complex protein LldG
MRDSRERILANIRASLNQSRVELAAIAAQTDQTPPPFVLPPQADLAAQFAAELAQLEGRPHRCASDAEALDAFRAILRAHQATTVIAWDFDQIGLPGLDALLADAGVTALDSRIAYTGEERAERLQTLEPAPICISGADVGIAESGTLVVLSGPGRGRLASLLAPVYIGVLRTARIVRGLGEALAAVQSQHGPDVFRDRSNFTLISGPSRTADIELTLTLGVHGPREVHVVLID